MNGITRRRFLGYIAGLASASSVPLTLLSDPRQAIAGVAYNPGSSSVLKDIEDMINQWSMEGAQRFAGDKLEPSNELQWQRLIDFYFPPRDKTGPVPYCTSVNAANLCPSLRYVDEMVQWVDNVLARDISFPLRGELATASQAYATDAIKTWIGQGASTCAPPCLMALTRNTTEGNNILNNGLVDSGYFNPSQDNVVVWDQNHPTNFQAWKYRKATKKWDDGSVRIIGTDLFAQQPSSNMRIPSDPQSIDPIIKALDTAMDKHTRVVSLSWQSNECGMLLPMGDVVEFIRKKYGNNVHIHADSAQTFGVLDLKLGGLDVDSIAGSFHKWPCGPKMVGLLYMRADNSPAERFLPNNWGYDEYIKTPEDYGYDAAKGEIDADAKRFSYLGQQNDATLVSTWITALFHTGRFHPNVNPKVIENRIAHLGNLTKDALYAGLPQVIKDFKERPYYYIATPTTHASLRSSVFLFKTPPGIDPGSVMQHVYTEHGYAIAALAGLLRIAPTINNTKTDIDNVVKAVIDVIKKMQKGKLPKNIHQRSYA
ncbi:aminotransferase class V-fold PLP-dependent enzyme [Sulfuriflexus mobilis]|uniref:aminotransferase class V-fold PLP-dependent enzyme n=1 Tax=Sulfuriflexus mobilis TaxID=1811807 RepID=UPI000F82EBFE|nr:aminotransferase class V-fold PLP-dependent enzyme [Sulfuriflexus mobilis]